MNKTVQILSFGLMLALAACSRQQSDWEKSRAANTTDAYEQFLKKYPQGEFSQQAEARVKELYEERDWQKARDLDTQEAYQGFLKQHPDGKSSEEARIRVENFNLGQAPGTSSAPDAGGAASGGPPSAAMPSTTAPARGTPPAVAQPKASAPAAPPKTISPGHEPAGVKAYAVQLGAFKTEEAAGHRWKHLQRTHAKLFADRSPTVARGKTHAGELYRLQVEGLSGAQARAICAALEAKSQACLLIRPARAARTG